MSNIFGIGSAIFFIIYLIIILGVVGLSIYVMVLAINFLKKGTEAFNLYIHEHQDKQD